MSYYDADYESSFCDQCHEYGCVCHLEDAAYHLADELGREPTHAEVLAYVRSNEAVEETPAPVIDEDWKRELAMEAGMLHGCDGYNEVMGY